MSVTSLRPTASSREPVLSGGSSAPRQFKVLQSARAPAQLSLPLVGGSTISRFTSTSSGKDFRTR